MNETYTILFITCVQQAAKSHKTALVLQHVNVMVDVD